MGAGDTGAAAGRAAGQGQFRLWAAPDPVGSRQGCTCSEVAEPARDEPTQGRDWVLGRSSRGPRGLLGAWPSEAGRDLLGGVAGPPGGGPGRAGPPPRAARRPRGQSGRRGWRPYLRRSAPPRPGMAALPPPDEQDFIQAYEEVREKYKGRHRAARPEGGLRPGRPWRVLQPDSPASDILSWWPADRGTGCAQAPPHSARGRRAGKRRELGGDPAVMPLIGHRAARAGGWGGPHPRRGLSWAGVQCPEAMPSRHVGQG